MELLQESNRNLVHEKNVLIKEIQKISEEADTFRNQLSFFYNLFGDDQNPNKEEIFHKMKIRIEELEDMVHEINQNGNIFIKILNILICLIIRKCIKICRNNKFS